jgi:putative DNA primase/helicase
MEAVAAQVSDLCLCLDEIGEADSNEVGALVYSLGNGIGKARATRTGIARQSHRWRTTLLSTGESSLSTIMHESGRQPKAGQLIRLLNIPVKRSFGVFDCLNNFANGSQMAHFIKSECAKNYGHAGPELIKFLINKDTLELEARLSKIESEFSHSNPQSARASTRFALFALAGELAIEAGILPWKKSLPLQVCKEMFFEWQKLHGPGLTEDRQILKNVSNYIWRFGDIKFTDKNITEAKPKADRSGWYLDQPEGRVFMFTSEALREAIGFLDFTRGLDSLDQHGWIVDRNPGKRTKGVKICGNVVHLYWIRPSTADNLIL